MEVNTIVSHYIALLRKYIEIHELKVILTVYMMKQLYLICLFALEAKQSSREVCVPSLYVPCILHMIHRGHLFNSLSFMK